MTPDHGPVELPALSHQAIEEARFEIIERPEPSFLLDGALLVTGEVARTTEFETGFPIHEAKSRPGHGDNAHATAVRGQTAAMLACRSRTSTRWSVYPRPEP